MRYHLNTTIFSGYITTDYRDVSIRFFFYLDPDPSSLISCKCWYRVAIRYLVLTNIFLDNTAALRKKVPASKLFLNRFSPLLKQSLYFHMALSYSAYAIATLAYHLPCVSRWVCDAALWQQTLMCSQLKCVRQLTLGTSISCIAFYKFLTLSREITFLPFESIHECLFASVSLPVLLEWTRIFWEFVFYKPYKPSSIKCSSAKRPYCRCYMSPLDCFRFLI